MVKDVKSGEKPVDLPAYPSRKYKPRVGFLGPIFLGTITRSRSFISQGTPIYKTTLFHTP